ncbi:tetratricopeptide repeat protein [Streptomyces sp. TR06-5]|uniref:serine/threonine-protein kinase n=1 Tax=unclassified Streptomyces TaxID=2593676 RepID=UPI0039A38EA3
MNTASQAQGAPHPEHRAETGGWACRQPGCPGVHRDTGSGGASLCSVCGTAPGAPVPPPGTAPGTGPGRPGPSGYGSVDGTTSAGAAGSSPSRASRRSVSGSLPERPSERGVAPSVSVRNSRASSGASTRTRLGAGLVSVPQVPRADPATRVLANPEVPERRRFCSSPECGAPVGRTRRGRPGRTEGFCTQCGKKYSFVPKLRRGDVVHGQYEVAGCLAHGGLGWIYLAVDHAVAGRWVVLKGLLDTGDEEAMAAAIAERRFLAEIEHANIVRIYNFVEHPDRHTGSLDGYIVMEYVGGRSLKDIANARRTPQGRRDPLPVEQACAYGIEALEALGHLHARNLLYCDFKVDNAIQQEDRLKLIDMGAVRRMDDDSSSVYGTVGYQAPEVPRVGPSVASDLYTVARTLAVLTFDFSGCTTTYATDLPAPEEVEVFRRYESFHRFLVRATDPDPRRRFASAQDMAEQLTGVLREVVALRTGQPQPALSSLFGTELRVVDSEPAGPALGEPSVLGPRPATRRRRAAPPQAPPAPTAGPSGAPFRTAAAALALPVPLVDPGDPCAGFLAGLAGSSPGEVAAALAHAPADSVERRLRELRAGLESDAPHAGRYAAHALAALEEHHPDDWRVVWYRGLTALTSGDRRTAAVSFEAVHDAFPGEPAPKLALAVCAEALGQWDNAAEYYRLVWATDHAFVSAAFGLARVRLALGDRAGAVGALESVPESSSHHVAARVAAVRARLRGRDPREPLYQDLCAAGRQVELLREGGLDALRLEQLICEVLGSALDWVIAARPVLDGHVLPLLEAVPEEGRLREGLERSLRRLARLAQSGSERIELVERANRIRPRTWV